MPPKYVKTISDTINFYYARLIIARAAGFIDNWGFITYTYKNLRDGKTQISDYDSEIRLQMRTKNECVYCGTESDTMDHVIPKKLGGPDSANNLVNSCKHCNSSKSDRDMVDWWINGLGREESTLPRIPMGIYLKFSYDWHKINHTLGKPANQLTDLRPFKPIRLK